MNYPYFTKINDFWNQLGDSSLDFTEIDLKFVRKSAKYFSKYSIDFSLKKISNYNRSIHANIEISNNNNVYNSIIILSISEDTYLLRLVTQDYIMDFKCDQIDGIDNCLKHCASKLKFTPN
jgi:hypothetical protein